MVRHRGAVGYCPLGRDFYLARPVRSAGAPGLRGCGKGFPHQLGLHLIADCCGSQPAPIVVGMAGKFAQRRNPGFLTLTTTRSRQGEEL